ncbi:hypothetical protein BO83DRAFT_438674 [Aspergillus eucalypticola CBS 122712]|uniref:Alpha/beta-hydrolase n=1 Tax=Aspergillus eucalypticola (strain CBS 122712 / IBT 29274) TaxID=1448314 RepID=A0A317V4L5_ASPEC|nr:uncharacterized protein BO83DRAFT_438674 [Aspergillus eucalypticola CBS 122712]PWY69223.1 hypothetical protein BO83DRAFT_438674 [Aspergillus eucalypticola CBS 122712]
MTGVKEQTTTHYAQHLHAAGFTTLTFDAAYQGSSTGNPRGLEDPFQRVEDIKSAVTYLSTSVPGVLEMVQEGGGEGGGGDNVDSFFKAAAEYYATERERHERSTQRVPLQSCDRMVVYDSFAFMRLIAPRPVLMIAGEEAETLHYSEEAVRLAREPKELLVVSGMGHFDLYDRLEVSGPKLVRFFREALA